ncbi:hypothetical protein DENIS_3452 [Desulfonema ishimotonii]|uniref:Uncharacterized protein n=1 Tax=Desulfonema ishimotonii TaxID=45657 RepID=A0A401FZU4_9BACT|nr:hypothetical protein [Desulfonema ishimotonii]GBC62480.1 hypothetical protein DENIS_3452 [Desulfonema ishimotonii]
MTAIKFKNNFEASLQSGIATDAIALDIEASKALELGALSAGDYYVATLFDNTGAKMEIVHITAISGQTLTVTRAQEGTSAQSFDAGDLLQLRNTAGVYEGMVQRDELDGYYDKGEVENYVTENAGTGDVHGPESPTSDALAQWHDDGTGAKVLKSGPALPSGNLVGTSETQTLTNKRMESPKLNEDAAVTVTATEVNQLGGVDLARVIRRAKLAQYFNAS